MAWRKSAAVSSSHFAESLDCGLTEETARRKINRPKNAARFMGILLNIPHLNPNTGFGAIQSVCEGGKRALRKMIRGIFRRKRRAMHGENRGDWLEFTEFANAGAYVLAPLPRSKINDHFAFHHCTWLFSRHAPRDRSGPCHRGNDDCEPPAKHPPCSFDRSPLGPGPYDYDSRCRLGNYFVWPGDPAKDRSHDGIVGRPDVDSSGNSESVWDDALDFENCYALTFGTARASPRPRRLHSQPSAQPRSGKTRPC